MIKKTALILSFLSMPFAYGQGTASLEAIKAAFIFHFIGFTQWQDDLPECDVCIPDDIGLRNAALQSIEGKTVNGRTVKVVDRYDQCHILVAAQSPQTKSVLTIGPLSNGSLMEFRIVENKLRFAVNIGKLKNSKLKISSQLLKLAIVENG